MDPAHKRGTNGRDRRDEWVIRQQAELERGWSEDQAERMWQACWYGAENGPKGLSVGRAMGLASPGNKSLNFGSVAGHYC